MFKNHVSNIQEKNLVAAIEFIVAGYRFLGSSSIKGHN